MDLVRERQHLLASFYAEIGESVVMMTGVTSRQGIERVVGSKLLAEAYVILVSQGENY